MVTDRLNTCVGLFYTRILGETSMTDKDLHNLKIRLDRIETILNLEKMDEQQVPVMKTCDKHGVNYDSANTECPECKMGK